MIHPCRIGWYENGRVTRYVPGRLRQDVPADEPHAIAYIGDRDGMKIIKAIIDGHDWHGRLTPHKPGELAGLVVLFRSPAPEDRS